MLLKKRRAKKKKITFTQTDDVNKTIPILFHPLTVLLFRHLFFFFLSFFHRLLHTTFYSLRKGMRKRDYHSFGMYLGPIRPESRIKKQIRKPFLPHFSCSVGNNIQQWGLSPPGNIGKPTSS